MRLSTLLLPKLRALCTRLNLSALLAFLIVATIAWLITEERRRLFGIYTFPYDYVPILIPLFFLLSLAFLLLIYGFEQWKASFCDRFLWFPLILATVLGVLSTVATLLGFAWASQSSFLPTSLLANEVSLYSLETPIPLPIFLCLFCMSYCAMCSLKFELIFGRLLSTWLSQWLPASLSPSITPSATVKRATRVSTPTATSSNASANSSSSVMSAKLNPSSIALLVLFVAINWVAGPLIAIYTARIMIPEGYLGSFRTAFVLIGITRVSSLTSVWALLFRDAALWSTVTVANVIGMVAFYKLYVDIFLFVGLFQDFPTVDSSFVAALNASVCYFFLVPLVGAVLTRSLVRSYLDLGDFYDRFLTRFVFHPMSCLAMMALAYLILSAQELSIFSEYITIAKAFKIAFIYLTLVFILILASFIAISTLFSSRPALLTLPANYATTSSPSLSMARCGLVFSCLKRLVSHFILDLFYDTSMPTTTTTTNAPTPCSEHSLFEDLVTSNNLQLTAVPIAIGIWGVQSHFTIVALSGVLVEVLWTFFLTVVASQFFKKFSLWNAVHEPSSSSFV